jgi:uncharacterized protein
MLIVWDENKAKTNLVKHGINIEEAQTVLFARQSITLEGNKHDEPRFITIAFSLKLNLLVVVYAHCNHDEIRIISARKATKKEAKLYEERI